MCCLFEQYHMKSLGRKLFGNLTVSVIPVCGTYLLHLVQTQKAIGLSRFILSLIHSKSLCVT